MLFKEQEIWASSKIFEKIKIKRTMTWNSTDYIPQGIRIHR